MNPMPTLQGTLLAGAALVSVPCLADNSRDLLVQLDGYGYFGTSDANLCVYSPIDIDAIGSNLSLTASSAGVAALDDGAALVSLSQPFRFYATDYSSIVVSSNGYLAFATLLNEENGGDFSNDPYLPAVPDNSPSSSARIYAYHDELTGEGSGASLMQAYFSACPRPSGIFANEACSVVRWKNWTRLGENQPISVELVLYHDSDSIAIQYSSVDASSGNSACVGLQAANAVDGGAWTCNGARPIASASALCFFDPNHLPSGAPDPIYGDGFEITTP